MTTNDIPRIGEIAGRPVTLHFGDPVAEHAALHRGAMAVDRSARGRMRVRGERAADLLTGLVTNDVKALRPGQGQYAAALTAKGRIVADVRIFAEPDALLVDVPARAMAGWMELVRKFVNPRWAPYEDVSAQTRAVGVFGPEARRVVAGVAGLDMTALGALPEYGHLRAELGGAPALVARIPELAVEGYELIMDADAFEDAWQRLLAAGATAGGLEAWEIARVEAGQPEWGVDIDETTIPQEANMDELGAISYTKGCYTGQEVVARIHFRGHVNRHLRGLRSGDGTAVSTGAQLIAESGKTVGDVRSAVISPELGPIALAMVRREVEPGSTVIARWDGGEAPVEVVRLPFLAAGATSA